MWMANAQFQLKASPKLGEVEGKICYYENRKLEECMILPGKDLDLGDVKEGMQPEFPRSSWRKHPVHKLTIRWKVIPNLPKSKTTKGK